MLAGHAPIKDVPHHIESCQLMPLPLINKRSFSGQYQAAWISSLILMTLPAVATAEGPKPLAPQSQLCPAPPKEGNTSVSATDPSPSSAGPEQDKVSPKAMIAWLLDENLVRDVALDADGDGNTLIGEKILALTDDDFCASVSMKCSEADEASLSKARQQLQAFVAADGAPGYVIQRLDEAGNVVPGKADDITARDLLESYKPTVQIRCVPLPKASQQAEKAQKPYWHENGNGGFRLSGNVDNLSKSRGSLGAVKAAELSITSDLIEDETAYRVNAVAGYAFDVAGGEDFQTSFIPFLSAERVTSGSETQIDTLGAGFQQAASVNWPGELISEFAVTPIYETDSDFESHTGTLKFRWTPTLAPAAPFPLGFSQVYGPAELRFGLDFLVDAGRVFDEGDQGNLNGEGNFVRLGNQAAFQLRGAPGNPFRQIELQIANRYLYNIDTDFEHINQFDAALAYLFPGNEHYQLSFAYSNGRDDNSLELYEFWKTQFGIRF